MFVNRDDDGCSTAEQESPADSNPNPAFGREIADRAEIIKLCRFIIRPNLEENRCQVDSTGKQFS